MATKMTKSRIVKDQIFASSLAAKMVATEFCQVRLFLIYNAEGEYFLIVRFKKGFFRTKNKINH